MYDICGVRNRGKGKDKGEMAAGDEVFIYC
jgi:hypothetical protein